jgi:AcrR family transcriptional regulator
MADKKVHIINKAIEMFAVKGFEGTSIRDLAASAEVNVAMINYYFGSKEKLFEAILEAKAFATRGILDEIAHDKNLLAIDKIDRIIETYVNRFFSHRDFHRVIQQELMLGNRESTQEMIVNLLFPNSKIIANVIEEGIRTKEFEPVDPQLTFASLIGTINSVLQSKKFCNKFINREESYVPYDDPNFRKRVIDHLKHMLRKHLTK